MESFCPEVERRDYVLNPDLSSTDQCDWILVNLVRLAAWNKQRNALNSLTMTYWSRNQQNRFPGSTPCLPPTTVLRHVAALTSRTIFQKGGKTGSFGHHTTYWIPIFGYYATYWTPPLFGHHTTFWIPPLWAPHHILDPPLWVPCTINTSM